MIDRFSVRHAVFDTAVGSGPGELPGRLCRLLRTDLGMDAVTISLLSHTPYRQVCCASDLRALSLELLQYELGEGPSVSASALGRPVVADDLRADEGRWPVFGPRARARLPAAGALYAFPLRFRRRVLGSVGLVRRTPGALSEEEHALCAAAADAVAVVLLDDFHRLLRDPRPAPWHPGRPRLKRKDV
ncbi:GAF domain-containing protein [Streptomyces sp. WMMC500]|uniref:GAF domain-containing protein n=1 Tax=Streptomyces sp. WMMC500 TaxID=3015154 RepID=UPI00248D3025|nr:GAF domain-containing protein [Streptomyces sp. WMMC500]WBB61668.1 GAF domain-containing protein [Streptomyces sp. WMMC500]